MRSKLLALVVFLSAGICLLCCSPPDVRMGMGDGDGVKLSYRIVGKGKPLVVIHDGPGYEKTLMYRGFDGLRSDMRVVYYDQRGCGRSEALAPTKPVSIEDNVRDLENLRRYLHFRRMSIAAHGWGAVIALEYARMYPRQVDSIILVTPISPFTPGPGLDALIDKLPKEVRERIALTMGEPSLPMLERRALVMREILPGLFYKSDAAEEADIDGLKLAPDVNLRLGEELRTINLFPVLGEITQPVLVIAGRHDVSIPVRDQVAYADGIRQASAVVFNESGHFPFLEERLFFLNLVREFLRSKSVPALAGTIRAP